MTCPEKYDLFVTDQNGVSHGLVCDWAKGGIGLKLDPAPDITHGWNVSTKGDYGVRDANDFWRIIQSDWSEGCGQPTYDRDSDSASSFQSSEDIDTSDVGKFRLGPSLQAFNTGDQIVHALAAGVALGDKFFFTCNLGAGNYIRYCSSDITSVSAPTGTTPTGMPGGLCTDGVKVYAATANGVYCGGTTGWATYSNDSSNGNNSYFTDCAWAGGTLYACKGTTSSSAWLGYFDTASPPVWRALSPAATRSINLAAAVTFGLVSNANYVYWGITNNGQTNLYKAMRVSDGNDVFQEVASFPQGFVGISLYAYLGTVYVGGYYQSATTNMGLGAIYAVINDQPVLLTTVGQDRSTDNRVMAITGYAKNLYFVSAGRIWRWDIVHGGYSHWAGDVNNPLGAAATNSIPVMEQTTVDWDMGSAPAGATVSDGGMSLTWGGWLTVRNNHKSENAVISQATSIPNAIGSTTTISLPADALRYQAEFSLPYMALGVRDDTRYFFAYFTPKSASSYEVSIHDAEGNALCYFGSYNGTQSHTFRFVISGAQVTSYCDYTCLGAVQIPAVTGPSGTNLVSLDFFAGTSDHPSNYNFVVDDVSWYNAVHQIGTITPATGIGLACLNDEVYATCSGIGIFRTRRSTTATSGYLLTSKSSGNMPTVNKLFTGVNVTTEDIFAGLSCQAIVDGLMYDMTESDETVGTRYHVFHFPYPVIGRAIQLRFAIDTAAQTPVVTEHSVLFLPMPGSKKVYTYAIRCWEGVESRVTGQKWDENAQEVADWLEDTCHTLVTVERPGRDAYWAVLDALDYIEAPPSKQANGREGLYSLQIKELY